MVHHFVVYECQGNFNDSHYGVGFDCRDKANMPLKECYSYNVMAVWGIGGEVGSVRVFPLYSNYLSQNK